MADTTTMKLHVLNTFGFLSKVAIFAAGMYIPRYLGWSVGGPAAAVLLGMAAIVSISSSYVWALAGGFMFGVSSNSWLPLAYYTVLRFIGFVLYFKMIRFVDNISPRGKSKIPGYLLKPPEEKLLE